MAVHASEIPKHTMAMSDGLCFKPSKRVKNYFVGLVVVVAAYQSEYFAGAGH